MKILLTGATGFIGRQLARRLRDAGNDVCALVRTSSNITELAQDRIATVVDDGASDLRVLLDAGGPFQGVVHLASVF
ncbi:MAG: NAD(P)-dependent oxidoreductase, partial [Magnetococcus sp. WYHC-3]